MQNTSLARILSSLDKNELKDFDKFVNTPFFVGRKKAVELFKILKKHHPDFSSPKLEKRALYEKLYPGEKYNDTLMRKLISELNKSVERYLAYLNFTSDDFASRIHLIREVNLRGLNKEADSKIKEAFKEMTKNPVRDEGHYLNKFLLTEQNGWLLLNNAPGLAANVQNAYDSYCYSFLMTILRYYLRMLNDEQNINAGYKKTLMNDIMAIVKGSKFIDAPVIAIYYHAVNTLLEPYSDEYYVLFKDNLLKHGNKLGKGVEMDFYIILVNYFVMRGNMGEKEFLEEAHKLYKKFFRKGYHIVRGHILPSFFDHAIMISLDLDNVSYAEKFLLKHGNELHSDEKENVLNYNKARISLKKGEFEKALEYISKIGHNYSQTKVSVRLLNLQLYYEMNMFDPALHLIDSFRHFLSDNKRVSDNTRNRAKLMLRIIHQLMRVKSGSKRSSLDEVKKLLAKNKNIMRRYWIVEKIEELEALQKN